MCSLFRNKYRIEPCRLKGHDYSKGSRYFITICTHGKAIWFGNILNQQMILSEYGQIAKKLWQELPEHFSFVSLDEYVIMPDHVHGIIIINPCADDDVIDVETSHTTDVETSHLTDVETLHATSLRQQRNNVNNDNTNTTIPQKRIYGNHFTQNRDHWQPLSDHINRRFPKMSICTIMVFHGSPDIMII